MNKPAGSSYSRKLRNIRFLPASRLRICLAAVAMTSMISSFLCLCARITLATRMPDQGMTSGLSVIDASELRQILMPEVTGGFLLAILSTTMALVFGLVISHRLYGPQLPIIRQIDKLAEGDFAARGKLRTHDEQNEIMEALNRLAETLEKRQAAAKDRVS